MKTSIVERFKSAAPFILRKTAIVAGVTVTVLLVAKALEARGERVEDELVEMDFPTLDN